ncbi:TnsD family Tn7-like transposition protein [Pandoraea pnomenusa]|uniref:TnsD family Tn7-like transposition protein n=1 Tax=Pandoraea pnomenusa TaxID=93220 RepID=UPI003340417F
MGESLFQSGLSVPAYTDESVYSWCARLHRLHSGLSGRTLSRLLSGHSTACLRHDFPFRLGSFHHFMQSDATASQLLHERTVYGIHAPFLSLEADHDIRDSLIGPHGSSALRKLGLSRSGVQPLYALKFCPHCAEVQKSACGTPWWVTAQQFPSTFICDIHHVWLMVPATSSSRGVMNDFYLPNIDGARPYFLSSRRSQAFIALANLGRWTQQLRAEQASSYSDAGLRCTYLLAAKQRGWVALDGSVRMQSLSDGFSDHFGETLGRLGGGLTGNVGPTSAGFLPLLLRRVPGHRHPMKHLMLMSFLFDSFEAFSVLHSEVIGLMADGGEEAIISKLRDGQRALHDMVGRGKSVTSSAHSLGIPVTQATRTLDKLGVQGRARRQRIVGTSRERELCNLLLSGQSRSQIAKAVDVRPAFIKDYLADRPSLKSQWAAAYERRQREHYRERLTEALATHPDLPIKSIRMLPGNGFQWLYNHDRDWLREILPALWRRG